MLFSLIGFWLFIGSTSSTSSSSQSFLGLTRKELHQNIMSGVRSRLSPAHRLLLSESDKKEEIEQAVAQALAEALIHKAKEEGGDGATETPIGTLEGESSQISDEELKALAMKWAGKLSDLKKEHDEKLEAEEVAHDVSTTSAVLVDEVEEVSEGPAVVIERDIPENGEEEMSDDNEEAVGDLKHIVVNFSTESLMNLWAILGMILIINVILYCCYTRRRSSGQAYLDRSDPMHDDV